jgi:hypothetical protein
VKVWNVLKWFIEGVGLCKHSNEPLSSVKEVSFLMG